MSQVEMPPLDETGERVAPENHDQPQHMVTSGRYLLGPDHESCKTTSQLVVVFIP